MASTLSNDAIALGAIALGAWYFSKPQSEPPKGFGVQGIPGSYEVNLTLPPSYPVAPPLAITANLEPYRPRLEYYPPPHWTDPISFHRASY